MLPTSTMTSFPGFTSSFSVLTDWDDVRLPVLVAASSAEPLPALLAAGIALQPEHTAVPPEVQWAHLARIAAGALAGLSFGLHDVDALVWEESGEFYQGPADDLVALITEILESRDAFGRLYLVEGSLSYLTDAEAALLRGAGVALARA